jgi:hypothetical protein
MDFKLLLVALCANGKSIDIVTTNNRTYQVSGHPQMQGMWRRHFKVGRHPTRSQVLKAEAQRVLDRTKTIKLWIGSLEYRVVTESELESELAPFPIN